jgi:hypothetical protein
MTISDFQQRWNVLLALATAVCTVISGFLALPQIGADTASWTEFGIVAVALLVGLWMVPMQLYASRRLLRYWVIASIFFFAASGATYYAYCNAINKWTFSFPADQSKARVVTGITLSSRAQTLRDNAARNKRPVPTDQDLLEIADGKMVDVWPCDEERTNRLNALIGMYLLELLLLPSAMVTVVQASFCATSAETTGG